MPDENTGSTLRSWLDVAASLALIVAAAVFIWVSVVPRDREVPSTVSVPDEPVSVLGAATMGVTSAPVVMIAFSDFECPFCGRFAVETLPVLKAEYIDKGMVQFAFRHLPLPMHSRAARAAEAAECAGAQGRFWPMHDKLFISPKRLDEAQLGVYGNEVGLDAQQFSRCMNGSMRERVEADTALARSLSLTGTPVFLAGHRTVDGLVRVSQVVSGARPLDDFRKTLNALLKG